MPVDGPGFLLSGGGCSTVSAPVWIEQLDSSDEA
jgi:hypothetical protein